MFHYVDIKSPNCKGWINLFFNDICVSMISDVELADKIKNRIDDCNGIGREIYEMQLPISPEILKELTQFEK